MKCITCEGAGSTLEHDSLENHDPRDGGCTSCPVQAPCPDCDGSGQRIQAPVVGNPIEPREDGEDQG